MSDPAKINVKPIWKKKSAQDKPRLFFKAVRDIEAGEELGYSYGEKDPEVIKTNKWLK